MSGSGFAIGLAIVSSLASMLNSTATIFTMDIYKPYINRQASEKTLVKIGRLVVFLFLLIAIALTPIMDNIPQMFQYIQEYTGLVSPGILAVFLMGLFWKKTTNKGAIIGAISPIIVALLLKLPAADLLWMDQMFYTLIITMAIIVGVSLSTSEHDDSPKAIHVTASTFYTDRGFNVSAYGVLIILALLYTIFW